jgi:hypothetical protein
MYYRSSNKARSRDSTSDCSLGDNVPSSRRIRDVVTVMSRCNCNIDDARKPVAAKSASLDSSAISVDDKGADTRLVMNANTTCLLWPDRIGEADSRPYLGASKVIERKRHQHHLMLYHQAASRRQANRDLPVDRPDQQRLDSRPQTVAIRLHPACCQRDRARSHARAGGLLQEHRYPVEAGDVHPRCRSAQSL